MGSLDANDLACQNDPENWQGYNRSVHPQPPWLPPGLTSLSLSVCNHPDKEQEVYQRVASRSVSLADFALPPENPLFAYLRSLQTPVEKIAAGQFTLESLAYKVNESFIQYCERFGDAETAKMYMNLIQPDELHHHQLGRMLLEKYATTAETQRLAREAAGKTLDIAADLRRSAAQKLGTQCFPGC